MSKMIKFVAVGDNHGDMIDWEVANELFAFIKQFKPDEIIHLGDGFDFRSIRSGANKKEESESLKSDVTEGLKFLTKLRPTVYHYGNHCDRLNQIIENSSNGILQDYCHKLQEEINNHLKKYGCKKILPYHAEEGVFRLGKIATVHGYTCGVRAVSEHAQHYSDFKGATIMGHLHRIELVNARKHNGCVGICSGWLGRQNEYSYSKHRLGTSTHANGWVYGFVQGDDWKVWQAHKVGGKFFYNNV